MDFKNCKYLLFDLDGTLTDSKEGIFNCINVAMKEFDIKLSDEQLNLFIGPPLIDSFMGICGLSEADSQKALKTYRERYSTVGKFENRVYDGVEECLKILSQNGKKIILATSKPETFAKDILEYFHLDKYFYFIGGASFDESRNQKEEVVSYVLKENDILLSEAVMIGDRRHDVVGAHINNIPCIGVLYGYGDRKELSDAGAEAIVNDIAELITLLI